ncbi:hypothetical protein E2C01_087253 [Portunus trituberculatus]|uniref:Uncharacterized protein n=1 Tax=Portunus trituberculatus TaxID=210409 RepID=A0A5B7JBF2_PORTR|nr:hypothetical protein [Portunus trituberculatus]
MVVWNVVHLGTLVTVSHGWPLPAGGSDLPQLRFRPCCPLP